MEATYLVVLLRITYDHTHLKVDMHPAKTIHPEVIVLVRIFEGRIQKLRASLLQFQATQGKIITIRLLM